MFKQTLQAGLASALILASTLASATQIAFIPPNDTTGAVLTHDINVGWDNHRGIGFNVNATQTLSGVGAYLDLTNVDLNYAVYEISASKDVFSRTQLLASGGSTVSTNGLEWIDYQFNDVTLTAGKNYLVEFWFYDALNQGFFYKNDNVAWSQGAFTGLDGTIGEDFYNSVAGAFRVDADAVNDVPEPASLALLAAGAAAFGLRRRRS